VPDVGVTGQDDADGESEEVAASLEEPADGKGAIESGDAGSAVPSSDRASASEETRGQEPSGESSPAEEKPGSAPQMHTLPEVSAEALAEQVLAQHAAIHGQRNQAEETTRG
jgi:hypothetical protein